jgi:hypothetical protein
VTGVLLSAGTRWGLLEHYWVVAKLVVTVGVITTAVQLDGRFAEQVIAASAPPTLLLSLVMAHVLMLASATALSVYKPWGKTWFGRRRAGGETALPIAEIAPIKPELSSRGGSGWRAPRTGPETCGLLYLDNRARSESYHL